MPIIRYRTKAARLAAGLLCILLLAAGCAPASQASPAVQKEAAPSAVPLPAETQTAAPAASTPVPAETAAAPEEAAAPGPTPEAAAALPLSRYSAIVDADPENARVEVELTLDYVNDTGAVLYDVSLRLWPNAVEKDCLEILSLTQDGTDCYYSLAGDDHSLLQVPFGKDLQPGDKARLGLRYTIDVPEREERFGANSLGINLGNFLPAIAPYEAGAWRVDPYCNVGDAFYSKAAAYQVLIRCPITHNVAASGAVVEAQQDLEENIYTGLFSAEPARDFAIALMARSFPAIAWSPGGVQVIAYADQQAKATWLAETSAAALGYFEERLGAYPYASLHAVSARLPGGMEYPGLIMIDEAVVDDRERELGELYVAHEIAHQWFYNLVGSDQFSAPWLDEAISEFISFDYVRSVHGETYAEQLWEHRFYGVRSTRLSTRLDASLAELEQAGANEYAYGIYARGTILYKALYDKLGDTAFYGVLKDLCESFPFGVMDEAALVKAFSEAAQEDLSTFFEGYMDYQLAPPPIEEEADAAA